MPIQQGRRGGPGGGFNTASPGGGWSPRMSPLQEGLPMGGWTPRMSPSQAKSRFRSPPFSTLSVYVTGTTKDSAGVALGSCVVQLFRTVDDLIVAEGVSDGSGLYSLLAPVGGPFYVVAYKAGATDVAGTTVNTLTPA